MPDFYSEGNGIVSAFAEGERLEQQNQMLQFERQMRQKEFGLQQQQLGQHQQELDRQQNMDALGVLNQQKTDLQQQIYFMNRDLSNLPAGTALTPEQVQQRQALTQRASQLRDATMSIHRQIMGPRLAAAMGERDALFDDLHHGRRQMNEVEPAELGSAVATATGRPISDFIDTPNSLSPVGSALKAVHDGMIAQQQGKGSSQLLSGFNQLASHELQGLINQHAYDGSTITNAEIAAMVPHPGSPQHVTAAIKLTTQGPDGKIGTQYVPLMDDQGHFLAHPDETQNASVKSYSLDGLFNHLGSLQTFYNTINSPDVKPKAVKHFLSGGESGDQELIDAMHMLGTDPSQMMPTKKVEVKDGRMIVTDDHGNATVTMLEPTAEEKLKMAGEQADIGEKKAQTGLIGAEMQSIQQGKGRWGIGGAGGLTALSPDAIEDAANYLRLNGALPAGFSRDKASVSAVWSAAAKMARDEGQTSESEALQRVANKSSQGAIKDLTTREAFLETNASSAERNFQTLEQLAAKVDRTGSPLLNKLKQAWSTSVVQDPDLKALKTALTEATNEYAKVITGQTGGAALSDSARAQAESLIGATDSPQAFKAALSTMRAMIDNRRQAFAQEKANLMGSLSGVAGSPTGSGGLLPKGGVSAKPLPSGWAIQKVQ